jgi:hypothetical protein
MLSYHDEASFMKEGGKRGRDGKRVGEGKKPWKQKVI